uniref:Uncharacterized protein n=1 Tax=Romanomermis culicivorax TaxID=13658 RepID=A0A915J507_ROMCU
MLGSKSVAAATDMTLYAAETQHEKTLRGLCVGLSLLNYGRLEEATGLIETLSGDKDPNMRRSAVYSLAMAYCGTGCSTAIGRLLKISVSDVNDDVRRAAVTSPKDCPTIVRHLAESYNPHVRYGSAMALGIACAGTASSVISNATKKDALALTEPMMNDPVGYRFVPILSARLHPKLV